MKESDSRIGSTRFLYGNNTISSVNSSKNVCSYHGGILLTGDSGNDNLDDHGHLNNVTFCTFEKNKDEYGYCIYFNYNRKYVIDHCNIIDNIQKVGTNSLIFSYGPLIVRNTFINGNSGHNILFDKHSNSGNIQIFETYIVTTASINVEINENSLQNKTYHELSHYFTVYCHKYKTQYMNYKIKYNINSLLIILILIV